MSRVLVVEPDRSLCGELLWAVRNAGFEVQAAGDPRAALSALEVSRFDVVVFDLPPEGGLSALDRVVGAARGGAVIATAAAPSPELAIGVLQRGARALLRKPLALPALEATLGSAAGGKVPVPPLLATRDPAMARVLEQARAAASGDCTLVLIGESGTGKDLLARYVHARSSRRVVPLALVDCALPAEEAASAELSGDAFRLGSATRDLRDVQGGTLVLHRVLEAPPALQASIVRLLNLRDLQPTRAAIAPGGQAAGVPDLRVIATSTGELDGETPRGRLRQDLRLRLDVLRLRIPPLRERPADIPLLAGKLVAKFSATSGSEPPVLPEAALVRLARHPFRGNLRELENLMRRAVLWFPGRPIDAEALLAGALPRSCESAESAGSLDLKELEKQTILRSLARSGGNRTRASELLGISTRTLRNKLRRYGLA